MRTLIILAAVAMLAGCATDAERAARAQRDVDQMMRIYGPACDRLGYKGNSDEWRSCVLRLDTKDNTERYPATTTCFGHPGLIQCTSF